MKPALVVIDFIHGIVKTGTCAAYLAEHYEVITNTNLLIEHFRKQHLPIFFVRLAFNKNYDDMPRYLPMADSIKTNHKFILGQTDTCFIDELNFNEAIDTVFNKKAGDPFHGSHLLEALQAEAISDIVFTGIATDHAILYGANTAMTHGYKVIIMSDACGAATQTQHEQALAMINGRTSKDILTTTTLIDKYPYSR